MLAETQRLFDRIRQNNPNFARYVQDEFGRVQTQTKGVAQNKSAIREQRVRELREEIRSKIKSLRALKAEVSELAEWKISVDPQHGSNKLASKWLELHLELSSRFIAANQSVIGRLLPVVDYRYILTEGLGSAERFDATVEPNGHDGWVGGALSLPNGTLFSWSTDRTVIVRNLVHGNYEFVQRLGVVANEVPELGHLKGVFGVAVFPDGKLLSWSEDSILTVWYLRNRKCVFGRRLGDPDMKSTEFGHTSSIVKARILPDGSIISVDSLNRDANCGHRP